MAAEPVVMTKDAADFALARASLAVRAEGFLCAMRDVVFLLSRPYMFRSDDAREKDCAVLHLHVRLFEVQVCTVVVRFVERVAMVEELTAMDWGVHICHCVRRGRT